uniref:RHOMBOID-like protein n=1 Tax=Kalanchoe fedtschenkoi TaxID=63787 RepID=A0A7N0TK49_KALFE
MAEASHTDIVPLTLPLPSVAAMDVEQATDAEIVPLRLSFPSVDDDAPAPASLSDWKKATMPWVLCVFVGFHVVAFVTTMFVNNCGHGHGECVLRSLGRFSFQSLSENPSLGPSASTLDKMGALNQTLIADHQIWRLFTSPLLHAGLIHLLVNLCSVIYVGIHLQQYVGPAWIGLIYILSALCGSLTAAQFLRNRPTVGSSGATFGLLGAMLAALIRDWKSYTNIKFSAVVPLIVLLAVNLILGLLPLINNFANMGGLIAGVLLGFVMPNINDVPESGQDEYGSKKSKLMLKSDTSLLFSVAGGISLSVLRSMNYTQQCQGCQDGISVVQFLGYFFSISLIVVFTVQGQSSDVPAIRDLRSLTKLEARMMAAVKEHDEFSRELIRAGRDGISRNRLRKMEQKLTNMAMASDSARGKFEQTRARVAERTIVDSMEDLLLVIKFLPGVQTIYKSSRLNHNIHRHESDTISAAAEEEDIVLV